MKPKHIFMHYELSQTNKWFTSKINKFKMYEIIGSKLTLT